MAQVHPLVPAKVIALVVRVNVPPIERREFIVHVTATPLWFILFQITPLVFKVADAETERVEPVVVIVPEV